MSKARVTVVKGGVTPKVSRKYGSTFSPKTHLGKQIKGTVIR